MLLVGQPTRGVDIGAGEPDGDRPSSDIDIFTGGAVLLSYDFVEATGKEVLITDADSLKAALERKAGTFIVADGDIGAARSAASRCGARATSGPATRKG